MKGLLWVLALFALAVALSLATPLNEGYVALVLPVYRAELPLVRAITLVAGVFFVLYVLLRGVALTRSVPGRVRKFRERRQREKAAGAFDDVLRLILEGRYEQALEKAAAAHAAGHSPGLAALLAARSAQRLQQAPAQKEWLERAVLSDQKMRAAALMLEAEMLLETRRFTEAVAVLQRLHELAGAQVAALQLELRAQYGCGKADEVQRLARLLEKRDALPPELAAAVGLNAEGAD